MLFYLIIFKNYLQTGTSRPHFLMSPDFSLNYSYKKLINEKYLKIRAYHLSNRRKEIINKDSEPHPLQPLPLQTPPT